MRTPYTLRDSTVLYDGRDELRYFEVSAAVMHALRRKLRLGRYDRNFFQNLETYGEAVLTWNAVHKITEDDDHWVSLHAWALANDSYRLQCVGPQAQHIVDKINRALFDRTPKWLKKKIAADKWRKSKSRKFRKRKNRRPDAQPAPQQHKKPKKERRRAVASHVLECVTPQFRKSRIFWSEALDATVAIFGIRRDGKHSAREIAARRLYRSLEHTDYQFAQYKAEGFCLQFNIVDGRWKGMGLTAATVSCTKDNKHPRYRRMRSWLRTRLLALPSPLARRRRLMLFDPLETVAA